MVILSPVETAVQLCTAATSRTESLPNARVPFWHESLKSLIHKIMVSVPSHIPSFLSGTFRSIIDRRNVYFLAP